MVRELLKNKQQQTKTKAENKQEKNLPFTIQLQSYPK